jgi:hypothetical protein
MKSAAMNALLTSFLMSVLLATSLSAEIIVYRESERARVTGAGRDIAVPVTTYIAFDTSTGLHDSMGLFQAGPNKVYVITNDSRMMLRQGIRGSTGSFTVFGRAIDPGQNPDDAFVSYFAKGRETALPLGNGSTAKFPRSLKAVTRGVSWTHGHWVTYESSSTVVFQSTETRTANQNGETRAQVIERLRQRFAAQGYVPGN